MTRVRARAGTDSGGWVEIPVLADAAERDRWAAAVVDAVARAHGDRFDPESGPAIERILVEAANDRQESDLLVMLFLPTARPLMATVRVHMITPQSLDWWRSREFALSPIRTGGMGHGMLATRTHEHQIEDVRMLSHQSVFVFTDGGLGIAVSVEPTAALMFDRMLPGLTEIVGSLTVEFDDGRPFVGAQVGDLPGADVDTWDIGTHVVA